MRNIWNILLKGLATVLPVALTFYLIYWLGVSIEKLMRPVIIFVIPNHFYWPGMGFLAGLVLLFFIGLAVNAWVVRRILKVGEDLLERIPLVKSVYGSLRDFMDYFSASRKGKDIKQVVMVHFGDMRLIGFVTAEKVQDLPMVYEDDIVAVYFPMSYQIGGYTMYLPRKNTEKIDMSAEDAMRLILTAGLSGANSSKKDAEND